MSIKVKQLNIKDAIKINEILDKKEKEEKNDTPIYQKLYPPLKGIFIYDENNEINNNLLKIKTQISKGPKKSNFLMEEDSNEITEDFLYDLVKDPCPLSKEKIVDVVSKFIQKSTLIEKLESDYQSEKKLTSNSLSQLCAQKLNYIELSPGDIVFKIGEAGDKFYFILSGNVSILKLKEIQNIKMTYIQYIRYCIFLLTSNEDFLLNEVIKANESVLNLSSQEDIKTINKIIFMRRLSENINKTILNNNHLKNYFIKNEQKFEDYDIKEDEIEYLEFQKSKNIQGAGKEWENYITKRIKLTISEQIFFQPFECILTDNKPKRIICFCYHSFLYLGPGLFFGDTALDFENNKRNATIRAEEKTVLAYMNREDYLSLISPKHKMEKLKELEFIYEKFFFKGINPHIFERNFFHLFSPREYFRGSILFSNGTIPRSLILLKTGKISLELKGSVIDIHNLIKFIYNNIFTNPIFSKLSQVNKNKFLPNEKISIIKKIINDPILTRLKMHNNRFIEEMNIVRNYNFKILTNNETIGLEEIFLRIPYLMKSCVISEKIYCYELGLENIDKMLSNGKEVIYSYIKFSINKVISLIERLQDIKQNAINMSLIKHEKDLIKFRGWKNNNEEKEEKKIEKNRSRNLSNNDFKNKTIDKEIKCNDTDENNDNEKLFPTFNNQNTSSPIKLFMTNISEKSKSIFEQMKLAYTKIQKNQSKFKNRKYNITNVNNTNLSNSIFKSTIQNNNNNYKKNKRFYKTMDLDKALSCDSNLKDDLQTKYIINSRKYNNHLEQNEERSIVSSDSDYSFYVKYKEKLYNELIKNDPNMKKIKFNFSYVPLHLMCRNEDTTQQNKPFHININEILRKKKRIFDLFYRKNNSVALIDNNPINNNAIIKKNINKNNKKAIEIKKRLKGIINKFNMKNKDKKTEKPPNVIHKKKIISSIIKDYYKDIRLNGYSSFIHNKEINTIFMRKYNKKYDSAEKVHNNIQIHLLKGSNSLPILFHK